MNTRNSGDQAERLAKLSPQQRAALFQRLKEKQKSESPIDEPIRRQARSTRSFPLSFAQLRLWFLDAFEPNSSVYNMPYALRLRGPLRPEILQQAIEVMTARHETLRTTFVAVEGEPQQVIAESGEVAIPLVDLQALGQDESEAEVVWLASMEAHRPFNLARGPLLRITLLRLRREEHILLLTLHHIISDAWSSGIFMREFFTLLASLTQGVVATLPELPIQYADFAQWQRQSLQGHALEAQLSYWKSKLTDVPMLQLPTDRPRPPVQTFQGAAESLALSEELTKALQAFSRQEGVTLFMLLLAAFKLLLYRYTGQQDIAVGSLIANRTRAEIEGLIGFFVNTLVMRTDMTGNPAFRELLRREREVCLEAYANQHLPFEQLVDALQPERNLSYSPLFQVMCTLQNKASTSSSLFSPVEQAGLDISFLETGTATTKFDLSLFISEHRHSLHMEVEYNTALFEPATIQRMLTHFRTLLQGIVEHPDDRLSALPLLTATERQQLLATWNKTQTNYPRSRCLHQLIAEQVEHTPDAIAVVSEELCLTYRELDTRANQLAHYLHHRYAVGLETRVGLALDRSLSMMVGLLGILKVGASYVALDPEYPQERLAYVLEDARIPVLVTLAALQEQLPEHKAEVICLDSDWEHIAKEPVDVHCTSVVAENGAYTIYTSGSTGKPKGVQITHQALVNFLYSMRTQPGLSRHDTLLAVTSISFDIAGLELFLPLLVGATVLIASKEVTRDGERLAHLLSESDANIMQATPTTWRLLLEVGWQGDKGLRILCGGEALPPELARQLLEKAATLWNMYGPTETTIWSTLCHVTSVEGSVPLGSPIANTSIYILDIQMEPVPIGVAGDLYIGGDGLSWGYLYQPAATAERFLPDPFSTVPGMRLYKTGDLARFVGGQGGPNHAAGRLEFLGRNDSQVKIHGYRIELQEIETAIEQHPNVRESVVLAREDIPGEKRLVAYIVSQAHNQGEVLQMPWQDEQVDQWQSVWNITYGEDDARFDPTFDLSGWRSSYTQQPIPAGEMQEWVDATVQRIRAGNHQRVLEIGCGTGLLLFRLAPHCAAYCGTDISTVVLDKVRHEAHRQGLTQVTLLQRSANNLTEMEAGVYDVVVLNSVVQYFPSADYLVQVLEQALHMLAPEGRIFLGDIRSLPLLEVFHTSVQLSQTDIPSALSRKNMLQRVHSHVSQEKELVIDPAFFAAFEQCYPSVDRVEIQLKRGQHHNELTRFRYDVVLYTHDSHSENRPAIIQPLEIDWQREHMTLASLHQVLVEQKPAVVRVTGVPNGRLVAEVNAWELLKSDDGPETIEATRQAVQDLTAENQGVEPEAFWTLRTSYTSAISNEESATLPYTATIIWSETHGLHCFDVLLLSQAATRASDESSVSSLASLPVSQKEAERQTWTMYTNNPLQEYVQQRLIPVLRDYIKEKLPEYMLPSAFVLLQAFPLTPNGKIDRRNFPAPGHARVGLQRDYAAPRTPTEAALAEIWGAILGVERVGRDDNFFELGGNSLLIIRVVAKANQAGLAITTKQVFKHQTIVALAAAVGTASIIAEQGVVMGLTPATPGQRYVLAPTVHQPQCYNLAYFLHFRQAIVPGHLQRVVQELISYHDALRLHLAPQGAALPLFTAAPGDFLPFLRVDISELSEQEATRTMFRVMRGLQTSLSLQNGPLLQVVLFERGHRQADSVLLLGHHLIADIEAWQVLIGDVLTGYRQLSERGVLNYPSKATSFKQWAERLSEYAQSPAAAEEIPYWFNELRPPIVPLPVDYPDGINTIDSSRTVEIDLSTEETDQLLHHVLKRYDAQMDAALIMAVTGAIVQWSGQHTLLIRLFSHGREPLFEDMDVSRTVGTFGTDFPVRISFAGKGNEDIPSSQSIAETLQNIKAHLKQVPNHGIGYGILKVLGTSAEARILQGLPEPKVVVNYIGEGFADASPAHTGVEVRGPFTGHYHDAQSDRTYLFQITGRILDGKLHMQWDYSERLHHRSTIEALANETVRALQALITHGSLS
ncbi:MAG: amino acid adenylation domain-containing protein [Ktedonobacteraceae bacterium]|nr:amino acid adenylation domain-containing protein [Ktedonobacteraceae bacterium]